MILRPNILFLLWGTLPLLSGCAQNLLLVRGADLTGMEQQLSEQAVLTARMLETQNLNHEVLSRLTLSLENDTACESLRPLMEKILENDVFKHSMLENITAEIVRKKEASLVPAPSPPPPPQAVLSPHVREKIPAQKIVVGAEESVLITPPGFLFPARMDTGAETASLDARNIQRFERDGERWVRFDLLHPETGEVIPMEQKLLRKARILQSISEESERRPVIQLSLSIGDTTQLAEFTLSDRSHLSFPVLIGRNILKDVMVVDVSLSHTLPVKRKKNPERVEKETEGL